MGVLKMHIPRVERSRVSSGFVLRVKGGFRTQVREVCATALGNYNLGWVGFSCYSKGIVNHAQKHDPARSMQGPYCISADGDHAFPAIEISYGDAIPSGHRGHVTVTEPAQPALVGLTF